MKLAALTLILTVYSGQSEQMKNIGPGSHCAQVYSDLTSCNTSKTLLACLNEGEGPRCSCVEEISDLPYMSYSYTIDMEWNSTAGKCMSRWGSVCNIVEGAENDVIMGHLATIPCLTGMKCRASTNYPPEHGVCKASGIAVVNSLIFICVGYLYWY